MFCYFLNSRTVAVELSDPTDRFNFKGGLESKDYDHQL